MEFLEHILKIENIIYSEANFKRKLDLYLNSKFYIDIDKYKTNPIYKRVTILCLLLFLKSKKIK
ncbi:unnamed protein product [marine sediment metagenome]|uniref:Uncharacterized protein n=1 Tax=marine sediment metagenome TaxID=412755 RepID=X1CPN0_9ZZZZ